MRILHTSDWHIGRTFHRHSTDEHLSIVLAAIADAVVKHRVDAVVIAGDVFDSSTPRAEAFTMLGLALKALRDAGATVVLTSGNHDGPARLAHNALFAAAGGVHIRADHSDLASPVVVEDEHGPVCVYGIPYLHPEFLRSAYEDFTGTTHQQALSYAMDKVRMDARSRSVSGAPTRYVVAAHCFAATGGNAPPETAETGGLSEERDIARGGLNLVDTSVFDGADYVALGHIHSRQVLTDRVRYSGAPLRFSFAERSSTKGAWLVDLDATGLAEATWLELPTPRAAVRLEGTLAELTTLDAHPGAHDAWVEVILTDDQLPRDAMRTLQQVYPYATTVTHRPSNRYDHGEHDYAVRIEGKSDLDVVQDFLEFVRNGAGLTDDERGLVTDAMAALEAQETGR